MHVRAKKTAVAGITLALAMICVLLASLININSLFFYVAGGFLIGVVIRLCGMGAGLSYFVASSLLAFFIAPDKVEIFTFIMAEIYIIGREGVWLFLSKNRNKKFKNASRVYLVLRWLVFQALAIPAIIFFPTILFGGTVSLKGRLVGWLVAQIFWYLVDYCYGAFQRFIEIKILTRFHF